jgi:signal transduction histidine kinase
MFFQFPHKNYILLSIIAVCAIFLAILSYQYSVFYANQIIALESEDIRSNAKIQADHISLILSNGLRSITTNLQVLSKSPGVQNYDKDSSSLFDAVQKSTNELPDAYLWLDQNGKLLWLSGMNQSYFFSKQNGLGLSYAPYFLVPREQHKIYYSGSILEPDHNSNNIHGNNNSVAKMYISYPILDRRNNIKNSSITGGIFRGVVTAIISFDLESGILKKESSAELQKNSVILADNNGTILSSYNKSLTGKNIFQYVSQIRTGQRQVLNDFLRQSLNGYTTTANSIDIDFDAKKSSSIVSEPIFNNGKKIWTIYVIAPHDLTGTVGVLFNQQNNLSTLMIIAIGIIAFGIAWIIISWNKSLESIVNSKTFELKKANNHLMVINEQLKIHDRMQNEFINVASHEMKTPTQSILLHSSLLYAQPEIREESIEAICRGATRLQRLTNDILDITRIESNTLKLNKERFNLKHVITALLEEYDTQIDNGKVQLLYEPQDIFVLADKSRITQVISNLLSNAIKFTKEGFIRVSAEKKKKNGHNDADNIVVISVKDSGQGIDPTLLPKLFTKFATNSDAGIGLGLYISKNIVESHGGTIWVENTNVKDEERGTTFSFILPSE